MAPSRIHIQQVRLEVGAPDAALARPLPERLSQLFQASLLAVLTAELTRHDQPDLLLRLPRLVLELPPVAAHRLALDLPDYLRNALRQALAALPAAPATTPAALATEELATLRYFLLNGRLPWSTNTVDFDLDMAIGQALRQQPAALRAVLAQVGYWQLPRQRLAQQLALPTLGQLLGLVEPTHAAFVQAYLRDTLLAHYHRPLLAASAVALRRVLHELALADLLGRQTQFNRPAFVERQLRQLATRYNLSYPALLRQLAAAYALVSLPVAAKAATLPGIILGLQQAQAAAEAAHAAAIQLVVKKDVVSPTNHYAALVYYLRHGSLPPAGPPLAQAALVAELVAVLRRGRTALGRLVQQAGGLGTAALALAGALPPAQQLLLLGPRLPSLSPGEHGSRLESRLERSLSTPPEAHSLPIDNSQNTSGFEITRRVTLGRLLRPTRHVGAATAYKVAGTSSLAEAQAAISHYLLAGGGPAALAWLRPLMRWVAARQLAAVALLLRRQAVTSAVWPRLLVVADGATLDQLLAGTARAGRRAGSRAGLATLTAGAVGSPRLAAFLKTLYLVTHFGPAGALSEAMVWQLAAIQGLPRRATWHKLSQLALQWPALAAAPFAGLLRPAPPVGPPGAGRPAPALAAQHLLLHYLRHGQAPWWQPVPVAAKTLGRTLRQLAQQPAALHGFLRQHAHEATVQQQLARLADFSLLHTLLPTPGVGRGRRQLARPALAALDRYLGQAAGGARLGQFLREAYLTFATAAHTSPAAALAPSRRLAAAAGLPWRTVRRWVSRLLSRYPALAAESCFGTMLADALAPNRPARRQRLAATQSAALAAPSLAGEAAGQLVAQYLQTGQATLAGQLALAFSTLLRPTHSAALARLRPYLSVPTARQRLVASLSERQFWSLLRQLRPAGYPALATAARGWQRLLALGLVQAGAGPGSLWAEVLAVAATPADAAQPLALAQRLLQLESALTRQPATQVVRRLIHAAAQQPGARRGPLLALLATQLPLAAPLADRPSTRPSTKTTSDLTTGFRPTTVPKPTPTSLRPKPLHPEPAPDEAAYIANAGLVLLWPFFTMLFERLGYLVQRQFGEATAADRAAHLLQFLVTGEENAPEYHLVLNKLLCGVAQAHPLPRTLPLTEAEKGTGEGLLGAALGQWAALKNTSIAGLRETFLQRPGKLTWHPDRVALTVETKTVDILLDQCPWSIALIKLPWMALPLYVTWR